MKVLTLIQSVMRTAHLLLPSLLLLSPFISGCHAKNDAPLAVISSPAKSVWKLAPGDRLIYQLKYASDSFTDLQALYGSLAAQRELPGQSVAPRAFRVTVEAKAVLTAIQRTDEITIVGFRFAEAHINVTSGDESGMDAMINVDAVQRELARDTFGEIDSAGRIKSVLFDAGQSSASRNFVRALLGLMQFARPENAAARQWEVREDDPSGEYQARYTEVSVGTDGAGLPVRNASYRKTKLAYFPAAAQEERELPELPKTIQPSAALMVTFDFSQGRITSLSGDETQTILVAGKVIAEAKNAIQLTLLQAEKASSSELASVVEEYVRRSRASSPMALSASPSEQAQLIAIHQAQLGDDTLETVTAALAAMEQGAASNDVSRLYSKVKALIFLHPETSAPFSRMLQTRSHGPVAHLLAGALAAVGQPQAQQALVEALKERRHDEAAAQPLIMALGAVKKPTQATEDALAEIAWSTPETTLAKLAQLQLGALARTLKKRSPERAARIVALATIKLSARPGAEKQLLALLGNAGAESALPTLMQYLRRPLPDLRGRAALALRFIDGEQADEMLAQTLTSDADESVRAQAANALEFRSLTPRNLDAQKQALLKDQSDSVRLRVMRNLWRSHEAYPEVMALLKRAAMDSSQEVRRAASQLLANP